MNEQHFVTISEAEIERIEAALEALPLDLDIERRPGGVLAVMLETGETIILNRHTPMREIWLAAKTGGFHFAYQEDGRWVSAREGAELYQSLGQLLSQACGMPVHLAAA